MSPEPERLVIHSTQRPNLYRLHTPKISPNVESESPPPIWDDDAPIYPPFLHLNPNEVEFTSIFPEFPKTHEEGYATVIELPETLLQSDQKQITLLLKGMQYSRSNQGGGGIRIKENVEFLAKRGDPDDESNFVSMGYHSRQCAGVKVREFFPDPDVSHTGTKLQLIC